MGRQNSAHQIGRPVHFAANAGRRLAQLMKFRRLHYRLARLISQKPKAKSQKPIALASRYHSHVTPRLKWWMSKLRIEPPRQ